MNTVVICTLGTEPGVHNYRRGILRGVQPQPQCQGHAQTLGFFQRYQSASRRKMIIIVWYRNANAPGKSAHFMLLFRLHMFPEDMTETWKVVQCTLYKSQSWKFWVETWVATSSRTEKFRFKCPAIIEFQGSLFVICWVGFCGAVISFNNYGRSTSLYTWTASSDDFWAIFFMR